MRERRVVVTGLGCVTPLGVGVPATWEAMKRGTSGVGPVSFFDPCRLPVRIAGECRDFDPGCWLDRREQRHMDRFQQLAYVSAREALTAAGLQITPANAERVGLVVGSGIGGIQTIIDGCTTLLQRGPRAVGPFFITKMAIDLAPGKISIMLGAKGPNFSTVSACASSAHAIGEACDLIRLDHADVMLAGGSEAGITELAMAGFASMRALSTRNDEPERASRPFDAQRDGFVMAEGAAILILEEMGEAQRRGAPILCEVLGYGSTADATHITDPADGGEGAARAMCQALHRSRLQPADVQYVNAHGTSTTVGDAAETSALKTVFGEHASRLAISSTKSMTGHLIGAAGAVEAIACVQAIRESVAPPTINYEQSDPACDLDYVPNTSRVMPIDVALNNSFGFGGHNVSLIFRKFAG